MPLLNHFAPPLSRQRNWESFHGLWAAVLVEHLNENLQVEVWHHALTVGAELPVLPLALRNAETLPIDLETTYTEACRRGRIE